jgi:hypothetical protein
MTENASQLDVMFPMASAATTAFGMDVRKYKWNETSIAVIR